jgi:DNA modification methylase
MSDNNLRLLAGKKKAKTFSHEHHDTGMLPLEKILNSSLCGDCSDWLDRIPDESFDMIYIDPPFFTRTDYEVIWGNGWEKAAWEDWKNSCKGEIDNFIGYMSFRVQKMRAKLKDTGTFWLHCDYRANYKFREMLEIVFGGNFVAEIVVKTTGSGIDQSNSLARQHDTLYVFSKTTEFYLKNEYTITTPPKSYKLTDSRGVYASDNLTQRGVGEAMMFNGRNIKPPVGRHWIWGQQRIDQAIENEIKKDKDISKDFIMFTQNGVPRKKIYWNGSKEKKFTTLWEDCVINNWTDDKLNYPTKKPMSLLQRIIEISCPPGGLIGDFFAGGGTSLLAASLLGRNYIGCDISPVAIKAQHKRFKDSATKYKKTLPSPLVLGMPKSKKTYLEMNNDRDKFLFEKFLCELCGWEHLKDASGQGRGFDTGLKKTKTGIQIKNWTGSAGVKEVKELMASVQNSEQYDTAILTAWSLSPKGFEELARAKRTLDKGEKKLEFVSLAQFLDCFLITEEKEAEIDELLLGKTQRLEEKAS